jgi:hypothetical protein
VSIDDDLAGAAGKGAHHRLMDRRPLLERSLAVALCAVDEVLLLPPSCAPALLGRARTGRAARRCRCAASRG